jgi:hypothetical protein
MKVRHGVVGGRRGLCYYGPIFKILARSSRELELNRVVSPALGPRLRSVHLPENVLLHEMPPPAKKRRADNPGAMAVLGFVNNGYSK